MKNFKLAFIILTTVFVVLMVWTLNQKELGLWSSPKTLSEFKFNSQPNSLLNKEILAQSLSASVKQNKFPDKVEIPVHGKPETLQLHYTIDDRFQTYMHKLLKSYSPDYGTFVAIDAKTGRILSMLNFRHNEIAEENYAIQARFPAASVFKVVTASAAIDTKKANPSTVVAFTGANHTLYKKNVVDLNENRWSRYMTLKEAFSRSVNTVFGKLGLFYVGPDLLLKYADRFFFNRNINADVPVEMGQVKIDPQDPWSVVTAASGFTLGNTMSPLQGALIAAAVANDGVMMEPYIVDNVVDAENKSIYSAQTKVASVIMEPQSAEEIRVLMQETVTKGTSRKSFRGAVRKALKDNIEMGGKTGSLTALDPKGKCDWFVGYALYKDTKIAVAALTINEKNWKVKSSQLASFYLTEYIHQLKQDRSAASSPAGVK